MLPAVTAAAVTSTIKGEHTGEGFVMTKTGKALIVMVTGFISVHPDAVVVCI